VYTEKCNTIYARKVAALSDPKTTRMYDRRSDKVSMDEIERIGI